LKASRQKASSTVGLISAGGAAEWLIVSPEEEDIARIVLPRP
jgi:hypothetical protein